MSRLTDGKRVELRAVRFLVVVAFLVPFLWLFGRALFTHDTFVFRDGAHFYYPSYKWISQQWAEGGPPLWNPLENGGMPVFAENTSAVLYPMKLVFLLPFRFALCYKLYIVAHVALAGLGAFLLARRWGTSLPAAGLCALAYALSGNVFFHYCNVIFLVGAAWLPMALWAADRMLVDRSPSMGIVFGAILAMMAFGGDPQTAMHAGLLAASYAWMLWRADHKKKRIFARRRAKRTHAHKKGLSPENQPLSEVSKKGGPSRHGLYLPILRRRPVLLAIAAFWGFVLAAVQILPTAAWSARSDRAAFEKPRSVYEAASFYQRPTEEKEVEGLWYDALLAKTADRTHHEHAFFFSVGPWRWPEVIWPNYSGRQFPENRRWINLIPAEGRVWTPSLYMGLLPLLLAVSGLKFWRGSARERWISFGFVVAVLGALGIYGLGYLATSIQTWVGGQSADEMPFGPAFGGVYWLMTVFVPGYVNFRYPAKLLLIAAMGVSLLAAWSWDRVFGTLRRPTVLRWVFIILGGVSLIGAGVVFGCLWVAELPVTSSSSDTLFGPLDRRGGLTDLALGMLQTGLLSIVFWWLLGREPRRVDSRWAMTALLLTAIDLTLAQGWMVQYAPEDSWERESTVAKAIEAHRDYLAIDAAAPTRLLRTTGPPDKWRKTLSPERQRDGIAWDRQSLMSKYQMMDGLNMVETFGTMKTLDYTMLMRSAWQHGRGSREMVFLPDANVTNLLGVEYFIYPRKKIAQPSHVLVDESVPKGLLWHNPDRFPRVWISHKIELLPELSPTAARNPARVKERTEAVFYPDGARRDLDSAIAVVESDSPPASLLSLAENTPEEQQIDLSKEFSRIAEYTPQRVEIEVQLNQPSLLILADQFDEDWHVFVRSGEKGEEKAIKAFRTNRIHRGVPLPPGRHRVVFRYSPSLFYLGGAISFCGWVFALGLIVKRLRRFFGPYCSRKIISEK